MHECCMSSGGETNGKSKFFQFKPGGQWVHKACADHRRRGDSGGDGRGGADVRARFQRRFQGKENGPGQHKQKRAQSSPNPSGPASSTPGEKPETGPKEK